MEQIAKLKAPLGVFAVLGNHDFWSGRKNVSKIVQGLEKIGIKVLRNTAIPIMRDGQQFFVAGVDDYWENSCNLSKSIRDIPENACKILLSHNPDVNEEIDLSGKDIDLIISGHTHGGQIVLSFSGAVYIPSPFGQKYIAGLVRDGDRLTYISKGLGLFLIPVRINCPPDVSLITVA